MRISKPQPSALSCCDVLVLGGATQEGSRELQGFGHGHSPAGLESLSLTMSAPYVKSKLDAPLPFFPASMLCAWAHHLPRPQPLWALGGASGFSRTLSCGGEYDRKMAHLGRSILQLLIRNGFDTPFSFLAVFFFQFGKPDTSCEPKKL